MSKELTIVNLNSDTLFRSCPVINLDQNFELKFSNLEIDTAVRIEIMLEERFLGIQKRRVDLKNNISSLYVMVSVENATPMYNEIRCFILEDQKW